jgi:outer membrane protein OmpA-like peptidoglycan-associated protein
MALTTMVFKKMFRKARNALVAAACLLFVEHSGPLQAQTHVIASSPPDSSGVPDATIAGRIVLHGVRFQTQSDKIDKRSLPVLDYGAQILRGSPESLIYVEIHFTSDSKENYIGGNSALSNRRARTLVRYFGQRGVSAARLVLLATGNATSMPNQDGAEVRGLEQNVQVVQLVYVARTFWTS